MILQKKEDVRDQLLNKTPAPPLEPFEHEDIQLSFDKQAQPDIIRSYPEQTQFSQVCKDQQKEWYIRPALSLPSRSPLEKKEARQGLYDPIEQSENDSALTTESSQQVAPLDEQPATTQTATQQAPPIESPLKPLSYYWQTLFKRRVPELRQVGATECGAACLAMILSYYGRPTSVSEVRKRAEVGRDGLSALALERVARQYGLRVRTVSLQNPDLHAVALPVIVHWEFKHFIVIEKWSKKGIEVVDPALGRRVLSHKEFDAGFTGIMLLMEPGAHFDRSVEAPKLSLGSYLRSLIQAPHMLLQLAIASVLLQLFGLVSPFLTQIIVDQVLPSHSISLLQILVLGMALLILAQLIVSLLRQSIVNALQTRLDIQMRLDFFEHLLSLPYRFFQLRTNGDLLTRVNSYDAIRDLLTNQIISTILDGGTVLIYLIILLLRSPFITGVVLGMGLIQVSALLLMTPVFRRLTRQLLIARGRTQGYLQEALTGVATLKAAGSEPRALAKWINYFFEEEQLSVNSASLSAIMNTIIGTLRGGAPLVLIAIGAVQVMQGTLSLGSMLSINALAAAFLVPLNSLASTTQQVQQAQAHFERIADVLNEDAEQDIGSVNIPPHLSGRIDVEDVSFQYDTHTPFVLRDISVSIAPGQKVALVGKTGSGKSTLGKLLIGLIIPTSGVIRYDSIPLHTLNYHEVRKQFGVVLQEATVFSGSIRENIAFNAPSLPMDEVMHAAHLAALDQDIKRMPMQYDTLISEAGSAISGGQRQRLALARALATHPTILLLDEATSSLDVVTEQQVDQQLNLLSCTRIVIAHRLSTIRNADLILVLDKGKIVERGTHEELIRQRGVYEKLIRVQVQNEELDTFLRKSVY